MYYTTSTTTAAPVWANTWAIMPELPTISTEAATESTESRAARLWAVVKDYALGTFDSIKTRTKRTAAKVGRTVRPFAAAALLLFVRVLFAAVGVCSGVAVMFAAALILPEITPNGFAAALLLRVPAMFAAVGLWAVVWCWTVNHILPARFHEYLMYGNR